MRLSRRGTSGADVSKLCGVSGNAIALLFISLHRTPVPLFLDLKKLSDWNLCSSLRKGASPTEGLDRKSATSGRLVSRLDVV